MSRVSEEFLSACLDGEERLVARLLRRRTKTWSSFASSSFHVNCVDANGRGGLHLASLGNFPAIVQLLISLPEIQVNQTDMFGYTALMCAASLPRGLGADVAKILLQRKELDLDWRDSEGRGAEELARISGSTIVVNMIRQARAVRMGGVWGREEETEDEEEEAKRFGEMGH